MNDMPPDPWGPPEEIMPMMHGLHQLHSAAMAAGFPEHTATQFITGVFCSLIARVQEQPSPGGG